MAEQRCGFNQTGSWSSSKKIFLSISASKKNDKFADNNTENDLLISAVKQLIAINRIQNKSFCLT